MLRLAKETLTELTADQMSAVVGGTVGTVPAVIRYESCYMASCITNA